MLGAADPPVRSADPAGAVGKEVSPPVGSGVAGGVDVPGGIGDVGAGRRFPGSGVVFCCVAGAGVADPAADVTGTVSAVPDPGDTDEDEL